MSTTQPQRTWRGRTITRHADPGSNDPRDVTWVMQCADCKTDIFCPDGEQEALDLVVTHTCDKELLPA